MSDHLLPDDSRQWPDDPFELLGIVPPTTETDLKRAYTRLIRRYKPEHHPDEFRRIREAYESALQRIHWFHYTSSPEASTSEPAPPETVESRTEPTAEPVEQLPRPLMIDPTQEAWALAIAGQRSEAYSRLVQLANANPASAEAPIRLYWLLALDPALDPDRSRHDWLAATLTRSGLGHSARELYRRELAANPQDALFGPYLRLFELPAVEPSSLLDMARARLLAAGRGRWQARLDGDLKCMAEREAEFDESAWLSYLVELMGYAAFDQAGESIERSRDLLRDLHHLELTHSWAFDRVDELIALGETWRRTPLIPEPVRQVVRHAWLGSPEGWHEALALASSWAADDPARALYEIDRAAEVSNAEPFLKMLNQLLNDRGWSSGGDFPAGLIRGLVASFLADGIRKEYTTMHRPSFDSSSRKTSTPRNWYWLAGWIPDSLRDHSSNLSAMTVYCSSSVA